MRQLKGAQPADHLAGSQRLLVNLAQRIAKVIFVAAGIREQAPTCLRIGSNSSQGLVDLVCNPLGRFLSNERERSAAHDACA